MIPKDIGSHGNAWKNEAVLADGLSNIVYLHDVTTVTIFGNSSAGISINIKASQNGVNFYDVAFISVGLEGGDFGATMNWGARYMRLQATAASTITATIAGKT